jgi:isopentenyl-diphosphate delta-isomerase
LNAAIRRLKEEMGIETELHFKTSFIYKSEFDNHLIEHEFDHIFTGQFDLNPVINPEEVNAFKWVDLQNLKEEIKKTPEIYTVWFKIAVEKFF